MINESRMFRQTRRKISKKKIAILLLSLLLLFFIIKLPIDAMNERKKEIARQKELEQVQIELKESLDELQELKLEYEQLYSNTISSQTRFEMIMDSILYDYYYSKYYGVEE